MDCPLNDRSIPEDDKSVSEIITDYANNQVNLILATICVRYFILIHSFILQN